jgi:hypothetical protein
MKNYRIVPFATLFPKSVMNLDEVERALREHPQIYSYSVGTYRVFYCADKETPCYYDWTVFHKPTTETAHEILGGGHLSFCEDCYKIFSAFLPPRDTFLQRRELIGSLVRQPKADACTLCYGRERKSCLMWGVCKSCYEDHRKQEDYLIWLWPFLLEVFGRDVGGVICGIMARI